MRELDMLLEGYLVNDYPRAGDRQKRAFRKLLALPDPELIGYLLGGQTPEDPAVAGIVTRIRDHTRA